MRLPLASPVWQQAATLEPQACWMGMATVNLVRKHALYCGCQDRMGMKLTNGDAQAVGTNKVLAAVAASELLVVAADGVVGLGRDVDLGVAGGLSLGGSSLGGLGDGRGGLVVAGGGGDEGGHGGDEESLHEGHFVGLGFGWWGSWKWWWWWLVEWKRVCWIGSGLDVLDDEEKLGWRAMEMGVFIPVGRSRWVVVIW
jgi:hypothetical protein